MHHTHSVKKKFCLLREWLQWRLRPTYVSSCTTHSYAEFKEHHQGLFQIEMGFCTSKLNSNFMDTTTWIQTLVCCGKLVWDRHTHWCVHAVMCVQSGTVSTFLMQRSVTCGEEMLLLGEVKWWHTACERHVQDAKKRDVLGSAQHLWIANLAWSLIHDTTVLLTLPSSSSLSCIKIF